MFLITMDIVFFSYFFVLIKLCRSILNKKKNIQKCGINVTISFSKTLYVRILGRIKYLFEAHEKLNMEWR